MKFLNDSGLTYLWGKVKAAIPQSLPNPSKLTINGTEYDGSVPITLTISGGATYTAGTGISIENGVISLDVANAEDQSV